MIQTVVETYDGSTAFKKDCRFIKGGFYIKNKQCFLIDGVWYRINSGFISYDHERQTWVVMKNNPSLCKGIVGYDREKNDIILGYYTPNPYKNIIVQLPNGSSYNCIDYHILPREIFKEDTRSMIFVHHTVKTSSGIPNVIYNNHGYPLSLPYCCKHYPTDIAKMFKDGAEKNLNLEGKTKIGSHIAAIGDYTFGFEFETCKGKIPNYKILESGLMPLRDGSITGVEYATIPLQYKKGIAILENACAMLKRYSIFSEQESLHLHIGNIPTTKKFAGYLYTICCILEKEMFSLFPKYYNQTSKFKARAKDYNMPLKKELVGMTPEETFDNIAFYLSEGKKYQGFGAEHPSDPDGQHKWACNSRYHYINFIPLLFGSNKTIEFRVHVPTRDPIKVINWLYICSAIIKYADRMCNKGVDLNSLRSITLDLILGTVYAKNSKLELYLRDYVKERKERRRYDESRGDLTGGLEIKEELSGIGFYKDID